MTYHADARAREIVGECEMPTPCDDVLTMHRDNYCTVCGMAADIAQALRGARADAFEQAAEWLMGKAEGLERQGTPGTAVTGVAFVMAAGKIRTLASAEGASDG